MSNLIMNALVKLPVARRINLERQVQILYQLRLAADYQPMITMSDDDARIALGAMASALRYLKELR